MKYINCTPHAINLNNGETFSPSGILPRVGQVFGEFVDGVAVQSFTEVEGLPPQEEDTLLIVSAMVLSASDRTDLVAPATGHPEARRNEKGHIISVPGFVRNGVSMQPQYTATVEIITHRGTFSINGQEDFKSVFLTTTPTSGYDSCHNQIFKVLEGTEFTDSRVRELFSDALEIAGDILEEDGEFLAAHDELVLEVLISKA